MPITQINPDCCKENFCGEGSCEPGRVCPFQAIREAPEGGFMKVYEECVDCDFCIEYCPYGCISVPE